VLRLKLGDLSIKNGGFIIKHGGLVIKHGGLVMKNGGLVINNGGLVINWLVVSRYFVSSRRKKLEVGHGGQSLGFCLWNSSLKAGGTMVLVSENDVKAQHQQNPWCKNIIFPYFPFEKC
jgi:hypothetical protein